MIDISDFKDAKKVFDFFEEISRIPHASENTGAIADYLVSFAKARGLWHTRDGADNVIIRKPAAKGKEDRPTIIFQGHTDMVADKTADCDIDITKEGLRLYRDGDFLRAEGTTLGGDDGVAIAYALAVLDSSDIEHPEFEALFTSNEEIGLLGATALDASPLRGKKMINIDSDVEGIFTVGCAGGMRIDINLPAAKTEKATKTYKISVLGLKGGHSGMEIDKGRSNAIKLLGELLGRIPGVMISEISGGNADNAIPRSAECVFSASGLDIEKLEAHIASLSSMHKNREPDISIRLEKECGAADVFSDFDSQRLIALINSLPCGVKNMSEDIKGLVETSSNLGIVDLCDTGMHCCISIRSSKNDKKEELRSNIRAIAEASEICGEVSERGAYPAWEYRKDSALCDTMKDIYTEMYGKEPEIITIHAGLECGIFSDKIEGLDCVSIGPDNFDIHTPEEHLSISSTARVWEYLKEVLRRI